MEEMEFKRRTKSVELRAIRLTEICPKTRTAGRSRAPIIFKAREFSRTNYRPACRKKSAADVIAKLSIV